MDLKIEKYDLVNTENINVLTHHEIVKIKSKYLYFSENDKIGCLNLNSKNAHPILITEAIYDEIEDFVDGFAIVKVNDKYGVIGENGETLVNAFYQEITRIEKGYFLITDDDNINIINKQGRSIVPDKFKLRDYYYSNKEDKFILSIVKEEKILGLNFYKCSIIDEDNNIISNKLPQNKMISIINENRFLIEGSKDKIVDIDGNIIYTFDKPFFCFGIFHDYETKKDIIVEGYDPENCAIFNSEGKSLTDLVFTRQLDIHDNYIILITRIGENSKMLFDFAGNILASGCHEISVFNGNVVRLSEIVGEKTVGHQIHKIYEYSLINRQGKFITDVKYAHINSFTGGFAVAQKQDDSLVLINDSGKEILKLSEKIKFISQADSYLLYEVLQWPSEKDKNLKKYRIIDYDGNTIIDSFCAYSAYLINEKLIVVNSCLLELNNLNMEYKYIINHTGGIEEKTFETKQDRDHYEKALNEVLIKYLKMPSQKLMDEKSKSAKDKVKRLDNKVYYKSDL